MVKIRVKEMPAIQKREKKRKLRVGYTDEIVRLAVQRVRDGELSLREASRVYQIPRSTLCDKVSGRRPIESTPGPDPWLTRAEERRLVEWLKNMDRIGYGRTRYELKLTVKKIVESDGRQTPFKDNIPGRQWLRNFLKRHPDLSMRRPESLEVTKAMVTREKIAGWFAECQTFMTENHVEDAFADPSRLFNVDETDFPLEVKNERVSTKRKKNVYQGTSSKRQQITVIGACNAAGSFIPPLIIFPGPKSLHKLREGAPENYSFAKSKSGCINSKIFFEYLRNHFLTYVNSLNVPFPIVLFVDGNTSHINPDIAEFCVRSNIILYCLPVNSSHLMQPLDVAVYEGVKASWGKAVREWMLNHPGKYVNKQSFSSVFAIAWEESTKKENAATGFRKCGLYPFDPNAVDLTKLAPSTVLNRTTQQPGTTTTTGTSAATTSTTSSSMSSSSSGAMAALQAFQAALGESTVLLFEHRQAEGFAISDPMYDTWVKLRSDAISTTTPACLSGRDPEYVSPAVDEHLVYPEKAMSKDKKKAVSHVISGDAYIRKRNKQKRKEKLQQKKNKEKSEKKRKLKKRKKQESDDDTGDDTTTDDSD